MLRQGAELSKMSASLLTVVLQPSFAGQPLVASAHSAALQ